MAITKKSIKVQARVFPGDTLSFEKGARKILHPTPQQLAMSQGVVATCTERHSSFHDVSRSKWRVRFAGEDRDLPFIYAFAIKEAVDRILDEWDSGSRHVAHDLTMEFDADDLMHKSARRGVPREPGALLKQAAGLPISVNQVTKTDRWDQQRSIFKIRVLLEISGTSF